MQKSFLLSFLFPIIFSIFISIFIIPAVVNELNKQGIIVNLESSELTFVASDLFFETNNSFSWPTPGYTYITSGFGYRKSPATGAATYHGGIDIGAKQGSKIIAIANGKVISAGWGGANGYCIIIDHGNGYKSTYGHVDPNLIVQKGDSVFKGQTIAYVGPKYVAQKSYTTYKDSTGKATNGATTGPHLHFAVSKNGTKIDPKTIF